MMSDEMTQTDRDTETQRQRQTDRQTDRQIAMAKGDGVKVRD